MTWVDEVTARLRRGNSILFTKDSSILQDLSFFLEDVSHRTAVLWALELAGMSIAVLEERYPGEGRPRAALDAAWAWAQGRIRMREAQRWILDCHAFAKELASREDCAIAHAIAQACSVVHTAGHALGYPMYDLTALVYGHGLDAAIPLVEERVDLYIDRLA